MSGTSISISQAAADALDAGAERHGITRREYLERLITGGGSFDSTSEEEADAADNAGS